MWFAAAITTGRLAPGCPRLELRHDPEHGIVAADARPHLFVVLFGVADLVELGLSGHRKRKGEIH